MNTFTTPKGSVLLIMKLRGKDYLQVAQRIVWFREERPTWSIETEFVSMTDREATAKATIRDDAGRIISTSHKCEDKMGFQDFREKAETGAIGRALALIGYGTQFCADDLDEGDRIVDSPIQKTPEGPIEGVDGEFNNEYRIPYAPYSKWSFDQLVNTHGREKLEELIIQFEGALAGTIKTKRKLEEPAQRARAEEFVQRALEYVGVLDGETSEAS